MNEQVKIIAIALSVLFILFGGAGYSIYIYLVRANKMGKLRTSVTLGVIAGMSSFLCFSLASYLAPVPAGNFQEKFTIPILFSLLITSMTFIGTYIQQVGNEFWANLGKKKHKSK